MAVSVIRIASSDNIRLVVIKLITLKGLDAIMNFESSVISEANISNRTMEGEHNTYDNSKRTHELSGSYIGGGINIPMIITQARKLNFLLLHLGFWEDQSLLIHKVILLIGLVELT